MVSMKLDGPLAARVLALEEVAPEDAELARLRRVKVLVHVVGDLSTVERTGLWTELDTGQVAVGTIAVGDLERVAELDDVASIEADRPVWPQVHDSAAEIKAEQARNIPPGFTGLGVVVGVVDSGVDIFHKSFRNPDNTTRIVSLLDLTQRQTITITGSPATGFFVLDWQPPPLLAGAPPPPVETTAQLNLPVSAAQLQAALEAFNSIEPGDVAVTGGPLPDQPIVIDFTGRYDGTVFDTTKLAAIGASVSLPGSAQMTIVRGREFRSDEINAALGTPNKPFVSRDSFGHGTHVAGIAAGDGSQSGNCHLSDYYVGIAPQADLAIVRTLMLIDVLRGAAHIFEQGWRDPTTVPKPAVVNISLGTQLGPHDGTDASELGLDAMLTGTTGRAIVVSAGNDGEIVNTARPELHPDNGGGLHASEEVPANGQVVLDVVIRDKDREQDRFDLWYAGAGRLAFNLRTPPGVGGRTGATLPGEIQPGVTSRTLLAGHRVEIISSAGHPNNSKHRILISIDPGQNGRIAPGTWKFTLHEIQGTKTAFDCWAEFDPKDPHPRFRTEQQKRARTLTTPATAKTVITVGAYNSENGQLGEFSSRGPTTDVRVRQKPDLVAPGVGVHSVLSGARKTGSWCECCYTFYEAQSGVSVAAPHVTGVVALMLDANPNLSYEQVVTMLRSTAREPDPDPGVPDTDWGAGKVDAEEAVKAAKASVPTNLANPATTDERIVLSPAAYLPIRFRLRELQRRLGDSTTSRLASALMSEHIDEIRRLIDTDRRVLIAWHRMHGPLLIRLLASEPDRAVLPRTIQGASVPDGLARLLDELARAGSPALQADIGKYRSFVLSLPGLTPAELNELGALHEQRRVS